MEILIQQNQKEVLLRQKVGTEITFSFEEPVGG